MLPTRPGQRRSRPPARFAAALLVLTAALVLSACGGDDPSEEASQEPAQSAEADGGAPTETTAQPPPESSTVEESDADAEASRQSQETLAEDAVTGPQSCPDVVVTPNSGDGLFDVEAEGITCEDASAALQAWGTSGYQGDEPPGFSCEEVSEAADGSARLSCEQDASGAVVEFNTGG